MTKILKIFFITAITAIIVTAQDSVKVNYFTDSNGAYSDGVISLRAAIDSIRAARGKVWNNVGDSIDYNEALYYTFPPSQWQHNAIPSATITWAGTTFRFIKEAGGIMQRNDGLVIPLMLGTNDAYSGTRTAAQILDTLSILLDTIYARKATARILLSEILPTFDTNTVERAIIQTVNAGLPAIVNAKAAAGKFIQLMATYNVANNAAYFQSDGVHLSTAGRRAVAQYWYPFIISAVDTILTRKYLPWK